MRRATGLRNHWADHQDPLLKAAQALSRCRADAETSSVHIDTYVAYTLQRHRVIGP